MATLADIDTSNGHDGLVLAIVAPGQGAQTPGFLVPWLEIPEFRKVFTELAAACKVDLLNAGTLADAPTIRDTAIAQPLLVGAALAAFEVVSHGLDLDRGNCVVAGHSVGEIGAAGMAGVLDRASAMRFVQTRSSQMARAAALQPTGMSAVLMGQAEEVLTRIEECGLTAANNNGKGQIVAAGTLDQLAELAANPPARARIIPLQVAGAFHTIHMAPAIAPLRELAEELVPAPAVLTLLSNRDGQVVADGEDYLARLVNQVTSPVRWDLCMATMADLDVTGLLELPPAGTLTKIAKRNLAGVEVFALNFADELDQARDFARDHLG